MTTVFLADAPTPANHARPAHASPAAAQRWSVQAVQELLDRPFMDLLWQAQEVHRQ
nr:biotin synthase BioB [Alicycliphilus sp.]